MDVHCNTPVQAFLVDTKIESKHKQINDGIQESEKFAWRKLYYNILSNVVIENSMVWNTCGKMEHPTPHKEQ